MPTRREFRSPNTTGFLLLSRSGSATDHFHGGETSSDLPHWLLSSYTSAQTVASTSNCGHLAQSFTVHGVLPLLPPCRPLQDFQVNQRWFIHVPLRHIFGIADMGRKRLGETRNCTTCGKEFYRPPSYVAAWPSATCSRKCAAVNRLKGEARNCKQCGKGFYALKRDIDKGFGIYCSNDCNGAAYRRQVTVKCNWCSKPIQRVFNEAANRKTLYCDMTCKTAWNRRFYARRSRKFSPWHKKAWRETFCRRCGSTTNLQLDHIIPRFAGGMPVRENAQTLCRPCNLRKQQEDLILYPSDTQLDLGLNY